MITLRSTILSDNPFIKEVFEQSVPLYAPLSPGMLEANVENIEILIAKNLTFDATGLDGWVLIDQESGQQVGFGAIGGLNQLQAYMAGFYFLPQYQRKGFGRQALKRLEAHYRRKGYLEMLLLVHQGADWAQAFYLSQGYRIVAREFNQMIAYGGERLMHLIEPALWLMAKNLEAPVADELQQMKQAN